MDVPNYMFHLFLTAWPGPNTTRKGQKWKHS